MLGELFYIYSIDPVDSVDSILLAYANGMQSQEPDPVTNARAVPIYATTVCPYLPPTMQRKNSCNLTIYRLSSLTSSMTLRTALDCSG